MAGAEAEVARLLTEYHSATGRWLTIATAESACGGKVAERIASIPGSSSYYKGSVVAYSNEVKVRLLGVGEETLATYGAVSRETALEMSAGGRKLFGADICISDTGIAGPSGGTPGKPVGLFYLGLSAEGFSSTQEHLFSGDREENRCLAAEAALKMLGEYLSHLAQFMTTNDE